MKATAIFFGIAALVAAGASQTVAAAAPAQSASATVATSDLDLRTSAGKAALRHRLGLAAAEVCGEASASDPAGRRAIRQCRASVIDQAVTEVAARQSAQRLAAR